MLCDGRATSGRHLAWRSTRPIDTVAKTLAVGDLYGGGDDVKRVGVRARDDFVRLVRGAGRLISALYGVPGGLDLNLLAMPGTTRTNTRPPGGACSRARWRWPWPSSTRAIWRADGTRPLPRGNAGR